MVNAAALRAAEVAIYAVGLGDAADNSDPTAAANLLAYVGGSGCASRVWLEKDFKSGAIRLAPLIAAAISQHRPCDTKHAP